MIPILLDSTKQLSTLVNDQTCVKRLTDCISCVVAEEANGAYTATLEVPQTKANAKLINAGALLKIKANPYDDLQIFRVNSVTKDIDTIQVEAQHITYDLSKTSVLPCSASSAPEAMQVIKANMQGGTDFELATNLTTKANFKNAIPQSARALMGGQEDSLLDVYGGYYYWDNLIVTLGNRGSDNGVEIRYGKNLITAEQEENIESMYTAVQPYITFNEETIVGTYKTLVEKEPVRVLNLDLSSEFESDSETAPTVSDIDKACEAYVTRNNLTEPKVNLSISYEDLQKYGSQFKEEVKLCDIVHVYFEKIGINAKARVISYEYDTLEEAYNTVEIGNVRSSLNDSISSIAQGTMSGTVNSLQTAIGALRNSANENDRQIAKAIDNFSQLITNGLGLFTTTQTNPDGSSQVILHNKKNLADSDVWYTINSNGFAISRDKGKTWTSGIDKDGNAVLNILSANIVRAMQIYGTYISGGTITGGKIISPSIEFRPDSDDANKVSMNGVILKLADGTEKKGLLTRGKVTMSEADYTSIGNSNSCYEILNADTGEITLHGKKSFSIFAGNIDTNNYASIYANPADMIFSTSLRKGDKFINPVYYSEKNGRLIVSQNFKQRGTPVVSDSAIRILVSSGYVFFFDDTGSQLGSIKLN